MYVKKLIINLTGKQNRSLKNRIQYDVIYVDDNNQIIKTKKINQST